MTLEQQLADAMGELRAQVVTIIQMHDAGKSADEITDALLDDARRKAVRHVARELLGVEIDLPSAPDIKMSVPVTCALGFIQCDGARPEFINDTDRLELDLGNDVRHTAIAAHVTAWNTVKGWRLAK